MVRLDDGDALTGAVDSGRDPFVESLVAAGEMGARTLDMDWSRTALGPISAWPQSLKTAVGLVLSSPVPIVMLWGPDGIMMYNDAYSVFAGGKHPMLLGSPVLEGWPEVADFNRRVMEVGLGGGTLSFRDEHLILHRHGAPEEVWLNLDYSPILDESGRPAGVLAIVVETTERVRAEQQVRQLNERLEAQVHSLAELDRAKTSFFTNISHEFRTPLTLILGPTEDALRSQGRVLGGESLETLYRNELRLLKLVNALLDFSRIEAGRMRASYEPTDLSQTTFDVASAFRAAVERAGLTFLVHCDPLSAPVYVDRDMWERIVLNLLSNALKFTFEGTIELALRERGEDVELTVRDSGIGIAPDDIPNLFERFHQIAGARARTQEGSGIGLALVNELVRLHGGAVRVDSVIGQGTTFSVTMHKGIGHLPQDQISARRRGTDTPARAAFVEEAMRWLPTYAATATPSAGTTIASPAASMFTTVPGRVLLADDNTDMREYLAGILANHWTVETVADGAVALEAARQRPPDVVLTDVMMPGFDGFSLLQALRADARTANIPVVMLSACAGEETRIEGLQRGADDYLVKPFSGREVVARMNSQIALSQLARERRLLLAREQTARKEAELQKEYLHSLFMQAPMLIAVLRGPDYVVELANPPICDVWGRSREEVVNRPLFDTLPEIRTQVFKELLDQVYRTGVPHVGVETPALINRRGNGTQDKVYFNFVYAPFRNVDGDIDGMFVVATDVTDQIAARDQVEQLREAAESANRAKDEFLAMLGHELRNPLAPIQTALQLMRLRGNGGAEGERTVIQRQVNHLTRLVDDLLDVSRITRGKVGLKRERVEMADIVAKAIETASPLLEQRAHRLNVEVPRRGLIVDGDPIRLGQIVSNLLTNAAKYTNSGGRITVRAARVGDEIVLHVTDTGIGIAPELVPSIFNLFVQGRQSSERSQGGLGLGLTIVRSLVALHGGTVSAHSDGPGKGSEFVVRLPAPPVRAADSKGSYWPDEALASPADRLRILVVDDNEDAADMLAQALAMKGHHTRVAHDGLMAIRVSGEFKPAVALLDIGLPVMDGYELAGRLRGLGGMDDLRLIAVTGYGQDTDRQRSRAAGFEKHLVKPIDVEALETLLTGNHADEP